MKQLLKVAAISAIVIPLVSCKNDSPDVQSGSASVKVHKKEVSTFEERLSYSIGRSMGEYLNEINGDVTIDVDLVLQGLTDTLEGKPNLMTKELIDSTQKEFQQRMAEIQKKKRDELEAKRKVEGEKNLAEGKKFLETNKSAEGVITTESGLQYKVLTEGAGATPDDKAMVDVHYTGKLLDGTVFDSSTGGDPRSFNVRGVIKAWTEVLQLMKEGGKVEIWASPEMAYGERGRGAKIPPNAVLNFEIELVKVKEN